MQTLLVSTLIIMYLEISMNLSVEAQTTQQSFVNFTANSEFVMYKTN